MSPLIPALRWAPLSELEDGVEAAVHLTWWPHPAYAPPRHWWPILPSPLYQGAYGRWTIAPCYDVDGDMGAGNLSMFSTGVHLILEDGRRALWPIAVVPESMIDNPRLVVIADDAN